MRRLLTVFLALAMLAAMAMNVSALTEVSSMQSFVSVSADGNCQISIAMTLRLDQAVDKLYFPVPAQAAGVSVNGARVSATKDGDVRNINLSRFVKNMTHISI